MLLCSSNWLLRCTDSLPCGTKTSQKLVRQGATAFSEANAETVEKPYFAYKGNLYVLQSCTISTWAIFFGVGVPDTEICIYKTLIFKLRVTNNEKVIHSKLQPKNFHFCNGTVALKKLVPITNKNKINLK